MCIIYNTEWNEQWNIEHSKPVNVKTNCLNILSKEKRMRGKKACEMWNLWDSIKRANVQVIGIEGEGRDEGINSLLK